MAPRLPILLLSKEIEGREGIVERTLEAIGNHFSTFLDVIVFGAIAGSEEYEYTLMQICNDNGFPHNMTRFDNASPGVAWNTVINKIFDHGYDTYFRLEDDFLLKDLIDLDTHLELLHSDRNIGMVRLGLMPIDLHLRSVGWYDSQNQGHIFFDILRTAPYVYSGNPGLVHKRLHDAVGYFHDTHNPGDIEIDFDSRVRAKMEYGGPRIWWPLELGKYGTYGPFSHIGDVKSY